MNLFITIDVETYTGDYERDVRGYGKGLDYILDKLSEYNTKATFFVEALGATRWRIDPLKSVCSQILEAGQEIQLHLHPTVADIPGFSDKNDKLYEHDRKTQSDLISKGMEILDKCGVKKVTAFRAGDFAANDNTLEAMLKCGLKISSNRDLDRKSSISSRVNDLFPVKNDISSRGAIVDLPLTCFRSPVPFLDGKYRHMQICAAGSREMESVITRMCARGCSCVTILTHPGEFFSCDEGGQVKQDIKNCGRFEKLLSWLKSNGDIHTRVVSDVNEMPVPSIPGREIWGNPLHAAIRIWEQVNSRISR